MFRERMLKSAAARSKDRWMASRGDNPSASAGPLWHLLRDSRKTMTRDNQPKQTDWLSSSIICDQSIPLRRCSKEGQEMVVGQLLGDEHALAGLNIVLTSCLLQGEIFQAKSARGFVSPSSKLCISSDVFFLKAQSRELACTILSCAQGSTAH